MSEIVPSSVKITPRQDQIPGGLFLLPICTTKERFQRMYTALNAYFKLGNASDYDYMIDLLDAMAYIENPTDAPCFERRGLVRVDVVDCGIVVTVGGVVAYEFGADDLSKALSGCFGSDDDCDCDDDCSDCDCDDCGGC